MIPNGEAYTKTTLLAHSSVGQKFSMTQLGSLHRVLHKTGIKVPAALPSDLEVLGKNSLPCSFRLLN